MDNANQQRTDAYRHDNEVIALRRQLDDITRLVSDMVWAVGTDFRITHVSHRVKELLGYHPTELYNRKLLDIGQVMTDDGEPTVFDWRSPFRDLRFDVVGKDGRLRHLLISGLPVYTPQTQEFKGFRGTARDITSARRAAECQRKLAGALQQSPAMVVITDTNGAIEYSNSRFTEVTGYQAEEIIGRTLGALNPNYPSPQEDADLRRILESGEIWSGEFQSQRKDGGFFWETLSLSAVRDEQGAPSHIVAVKEDITARKHAMFELQLSKEKAEAASRAKSEFLSKMSHELRTPLNAVIGFSQTMLDEMFGELGNPTYLEYASDIHHSGKHLLASINDILHLARIESGEFTLDEVEIELQDVIEWSVAQVRAQAESAEIEITTDLHDPALVIMGDEHSLRQIFLNLLSNAVKFTVSNGSIHVGAALTEDGDLTLSVSDDGIGIEQEKLDLVLHPFEQAENTFTRNFDGIGLGLSNVKALVELHGGTLTLASEVDKGTMVTVRLPACRIVDRATLKHTPAKASQT